MSLARAAAIRENDRVEVINLSPSFEHSYYAVGVVSPAHRGRCKICYEKLVTDEDETQPLEEEISMAKLRPYPKSIQQWNFFMGEIVDGYYNEGWWLGRIVGRDGDRYVVHYEERSHHVHLFQDIRLHQEWCQGAWMYTKLTIDY